VERAGVAARAGAAETAGDEEPAGDEETEAEMVAKATGYIVKPREIEAAIKRGAIVDEDDWATGFSPAFTVFIAKQQNVVRMFWHVDEEMKTVLAIEVTLSEEGAMHEALRRRELDEEVHTELSRMKFLYAAYEPKCWWFEIFETCRRLLLTGGQVLLQPGTPTQIMLNLIICIFSMRVYALYKPFVDGNDDQLAEVAQWELFFTVLAALCIKVGIDDEDGYNRNVFDGVLVSLQFIIPLLLVYQVYLSAGTKKNKEKFVETGGAMDDVRKVARSLSQASQGEERSASGNAKFYTSWRDIRAVSAATVVLASGFVKKSRETQQEKEEEDRGGESADGRLREQSIGWIVIPAQSHIAVTRRPSPLHHPNRCG
jgi:hypothetical protein